MTSHSQLAPSSFRDPAGFVFFKDEILYRQVNEGFRWEYDFLIDSGLYAALTDRGLLVPHDEVDIALAARPPAYKVIRPEKVPFVSYPYEWCFSQLREAALLTLEIQAVAMRHGMSLRDASAYNIQFRGSVPVHIDTLSFEIIKEGKPWVAYRQFCQHFLGPLALMAYVDPALGRMSQAFIDGIPVEVAAAVLPASTRVNPPLFLHIHQHAKAQKRDARGASRASEARNFSLKALEGLRQSLEKAVDKLAPRPGSSNWVDYYEQDSYSGAGYERKAQLVEGFLSEIKPEVVWDLGANTGEFSRLAAEHSSLTISFELDHASVEKGFHAARAVQHQNVLPLVLDLANPSPALGWAHSERASLKERGPADLVLALALVHHLVIGNNVPLDRVAQFFAGLCSWLVVEFIPKEDPKVQLLLASREDIFPDYDARGFEAGFSQFFTIQEVRPIADSVRSLYLMERHSPG